MFKRISGLATTTAMALTLGVAHAQDEDVTIAVTDVGSGIYMLTGQGGNIGLSVGSDTTFMIDDQFAPLTEKILAAVASVTDIPVKFVVNTHYHADHTGGNENLGTAGALIVAHDNVRARMSTAGTGPITGASRKVQPEGSWPAITFSDTASFHMNGEEIHVRHVEAGHTDGDSIIEFRGANVIHMGDNFFSGRFPYIDVDAGGSIEGMIAIADLVLSLADDETKIIPGHGALSSKADLVTYKSMLGTLRDRVNAGVASGKDLDTLLAEKPLADLEPVYGQHFMKGDQIYRLLFMAAKKKAD
jgi:cyclase